MDVDCLMHMVTLLNALLFACTIAILPLDFARTMARDVLLRKFLSISAFR